MGTGKGVTTSQPPACPTDRMKFYDMRGSCFVAFPLERHLFTSPDKHDRLFAGALRCGCVRAFSLLQLTQPPWLVRTFQGHEHEPPARHTCSTPNTFAAPVAL